MTENFGARLKFLRKSRELTADDLAEKGLVLYDIKMS